MGLFFKKVSDPKRNILFLLVTLLFICGSTNYELQSEEIVFRVEGKKKCVFGEKSITGLVRCIRGITDIFILQCNIRRDIGRSDDDMYARASVKYATELLDSNGFSAIEIVAPTGYSRPLVIGKKKTQ